MEDKDFDKKFPELAKMKMSQEELTATPAKAREIPTEGSGVAEPDTKGSEDVKAQFTRGLLKCTQFPQRIKAFLSLANPDGGRGRDFRISRMIISSREIPPC